MVHISHWMNAVMAAVLTKLMEEAAEARSRPGIEAQIERFIVATYRKGGTRTGAPPVQYPVSPEHAATPCPAGSPPKQMIEQVSDECPLLTELLERRARS